MGIPSHTPGVRSLLDSARIAGVLTFNTDATGVLPDLRPVAAGPELAVGLEPRRGGTAASAIVLLIRPAW
jgi:hypothetical protein